MRSHPLPIVYLPYADERGAGLQRFGQEMIEAFDRIGLQFELVIGERLGQVPWLASRRHRLLVPPGLSATLPRSAAALLRMARAQKALNRADRTVLSLAHEICARPCGRQIAVALDITWLKPFAPPRSLATIVRDRLWRAGLRRSDVVAISIATRDDVAAWAGLDRNMIPVVYPGVDTTTFHPGRSDEIRRSTLLYAGTLEPHKNVGCIIEAFQLVRERGLKASLKLVGRHDPTVQAALLASVSPTWRDDIDFAGFVSTEQLAASLRDCAAFLFPSRSEGFGLAPVEAMACGAPVLSAPCGSLAEVIGDGGLLLDPDDPKAWATAIGNILTDPASTSALRERAAQRAAKFSWDEAALRYRVMIENSGS